MAKKVLIFGCGGFVGDYLAREFADNSYDVYGTDIKACSEQLKRLIKDFEIVDLLDREKVQDLILRVNPEYIINLAGISSVKNSWSIPQLTISANVNGTLNILETVRLNNMSTKILLVGSSEEYEISDKKISEEYTLKANSPYGISKVMQESFAEMYRDEYGMQIICTRTFNHTGVGQPDIFAIPSFVKQVAEIEKGKGPNGNRLMVGNLEVRRDLGDVRDMARAYRMILESNTKKHIFNVGNGTSYCLKDIVDYIASLSSTEVEMVVDKNKLRPADNPIIWCDNSLIKEEIGWEPQYTIYDAIKNMYEYYRAIV